MPNPDLVPAALARNIADVSGDQGRAWLERLPKLLAACERRWNVTILPPFEELSYNFAAPAILRDGAPAVLKAGVPGADLEREIAALRLYDGDGICRLYEADPSGCAFLIERHLPGAMLSTLAAKDDDEATRIAARLMRRLWRPAPPEHGFQMLAGWAEGLRRLREQFDGDTGPFPRRLVERAERAYGELHDAEAATLLHGDFHHGNVLTAEREPWLAIDPKGVVGDAGYEVGAFIYNALPANAADVGRTVARRIELLAEELEMDRAEVIGWGLFQAVLSSWWTYEDHGHVGEDTLVVAEILDGPAAGAPGG
jgi:streptomycin 6-kinase